MTSKKNRSRTPLVDAIFKFIGVSVLTGALLAVMLTPFAFSVSASADVADQWLEKLPEDFDGELPSHTSDVLDIEGKKVATFYMQNRTPVSLDDMSPYIINAIVAVEDNRFYEHGGVDRVGISRALVRNAFRPSGASPQGASTITQQFVNNLIINKEDLAGNQEDIVLSGQKNYFDKLKEIKLAISVEKEYDKNRILEGYLNLIFFNQNAYGVEAASRFFFDTSAKDLTLPQAATLAGIINSPARFNPIENPQASKERRNTVLDQMLKYGKITKKQHDEAVKAPLDLHVTQPKQGCYSSTAPYFCDYVQNVITNDKSFGQTYEERLQRLQSGGYTIRTTLDSRLQDDADKAVKDSVPVGDSSDVASTLVTVEPGTGKIRSMAQNTNYAAGDDAGNTTLNFNVSKEMGGSGGFQPGSTFKVFTLLEWLKQGRTTGDMVDGRIQSYPIGTTWNAHCLDGGQLVQQEDYNFKNADDKFYKMLTVNDTIANSINTGTFQMAKQLDFCNIRDGAAELGVTRGDGGEIDVTNPSFILGSDNVAPLNMAAAYATFASGGKYCKPIAIESIKDVNGKKYNVPSADCKQVEDENVIAALNGPLQQVLRSGSGYQIPLSVPAAAKTGTTDNSESTWTVGYTSGLSTASWVGSWKDFTSLNGKPINGISRSYVDGATIAGRQWQSYMNQVAPYYSTDPLPGSRDTTNDNNNQDNKENSQTNQTQQR